MNRVGCIPATATIVILALLGMVWPCVGGGPPDPTPPQSPAYTYRATILRVVDGDTVDALVDLGFDVLIKQRLRLIDVYAAEKGETHGREHTASLETILPIGSRVLLRTAKDRTDKYGRYLAEVWNNNGVNVNGFMRTVIGVPSGKGVPK